MDRILERLDLAARALASLQEALAMEWSAIVQDGAIQRHAALIQAWIERMRDRMKPA